MKKRRDPRERLGDILLRLAVVDSAQLEKALERQRMQPGRLGTHLLDLGFVSEDDLAKALSMQHRTPPFLPSLMSVDPVAVKRLPRPLAGRLKIVPVAWHPRKGLLQVAAAHPDNLDAVDEVRFASGASRVAVEVAPESVIDRLFARHYDGVEPERLFAPDLSVAVADEPISAATGKPRRRGKVLVVDPNPKRRRALATLFEVCGFGATRAGTADEVGELLDRQEWSFVWVHESLAGDLPHPATRVYGDVVRLLDDGATAVGPLVAEAAALAEESAQRILTNDLEETRQAISLVHFLAGRQGMGELPVKCLELRAWRTAMATWQVPAQARAIPGTDVLDAVAAYQRALSSHHAPSAAAEAVRNDPSLDPDAVTSLLRWAIGVDLLRQIEAPLRVSVLFPGSEAPANLLAHMEKAGWAVEQCEDGTPAKGCEVVLASFELGLALLESLSEAQEVGDPPVFLVSAGSSEPDTMYGLRLGAEDVFTVGTHPEVVETKLARAVARRRPDRGSVTGNLQDMGLADVIQVLSNGLKTTRIRIDGPQDNGEVALNRGEIVDARAGELQGEEALYEMIGWEEGTFRVETGPETAAITIEGSTEGLLMEGFRRLDEGRREPPERV